VWDTASGAECQSPMESDRSVRSFMFSPDSRRLAACMEEGRFGVWEFSTNSECVPIFGVEPDSQTTPRLNKQLMELQDGYATPQCLGRPLCFSLDGDLLVTSSDDDELKLWNLETREHRRLSVSLRCVTSALFAPNGKYVLVESNDGGFAVLDILTCQVKWTDRLPTHKDPHANGVSPIAMGPAGRMFACAIPNQGIQLRSVATNEVMATLGADVPPATILTFAQDGKSLAVVHQDGILRLWDVATSQQRLAVDVFPSKGYLRSWVVRKMSFSLDGRTLSLNDGLGCVTKLRSDDWAE
jgi:WD40 repeat protein